MSLLNQVHTLQEERAGFVHQMREILDAAENENRNLTAEEQQTYERLEADVDERGSRIKRLSATLALENELGDESRLVNPALTQPGVADEAADMEARYGVAFEAYVRGGLHAMDAEQRQVLQMGFTRDQSKGTNNLGGFLVPTSFNRRLNEHLVQAGTMRQTRASSIVTEAGESMQFPKTTAHGVANWVNEAAAITATDETVGQVTLSAYKAVRMVKVSIELLQDNAVDLEEYLGREIGRAIGALENTAFVNGSGASQPQGIVGVASSGKVGLTGQTTSIIADDLIDLFYSVAVPYRRLGEWMMADSTFKAIRKLKDTTNNYLWSPALGGGSPSTIAQGSPDLLLGRPVFDDPDMPVMAANAKSVLFGDFSAYLIRDVGAAGPAAGEKGTGGFAVRRLDERFADNLQVGFLGWHRTDGNLIDTTGAVRYYANSAT